MRWVPRGWWGMVVGASGAGGRVRVGYAGPEGMSSSSLVGKGLRHHDHDHDVQPSTFVTPHLQIRQIESPDQPEALDAITAGQQGHQSHRQAPTPAGRREMWGACTPNIRRAGIGTVDPTSISGTVGLGTGVVPWLGMGGHSVLIVGGGCGMGVDWSGDVGFPTSF